jgi:two-component system OmpR family sensor kinase
MDGFKNLLRRFSESLQFRLSVSLSVVLLTVAALAGLFSFSIAFDEARELQDHTLRQIGQLYERHRLTSPTPSTDDLGTGRTEDDAQISVQILSNDRVADPVAGGLSLPNILLEGIQTIAVGDEPYRVLVRTTSAGVRIAVIQEADQRDDVAYASAFRTVVSLLILVPVLLFVVAQLVKKTFQPIAKISDDLDGRAEHELHSVKEDNLPEEVRPFVVAINRLLARVSSSMNSQQRFIVDAAHELRSPFTALSLQAERMAGAEMSAHARERLKTLSLGIARGRRLLDQLLDFARVQSQTDHRGASVSVQQVFRQVLGDLMPLAENRQIDIGIENERDALVNIHAEDLSTVMRNLVDNAIRYSPNGGQVDLSVVVENSFVTLYVKDSGPGIAPIERDRVFEPFYRTLGSGQSGSGLGLSIVQTIALRWGAQIKLAYADESACIGLSASVQFPIKPNSDN